ncbi:MAG: ABC transporter permease [Negativicoccus succinicivorans]|nr:ABC transporter permease [Negativicoccus succinicivorans]
MFWENLQIAWQALVRNKMRSLLTMLGIIIGVASVIALVSIGQGVQKDTEDRFSKLGSNLLIVIPGAPRTPGTRRPARRAARRVGYA